MLTTGNIRFISRTKAMEEEEEICSMICKSIFENLSREQSLQLLKIKTCKWFFIVLRKLTIYDFFGLIFNMPKIKL